MNDEKYYNPTLSVLEAFALGALIGAGVALLLAPESGSEIRRKIKAKADDLRDLAEEKLDEALDASSELLSMEKEKIKTKKRELEDIIEAGKSAIKETIKEELSKLEEKLSTEKSEV
jgi:gas vesicle protein